MSVIDAAGSLVGRFDGEGGSAEDPLGCFASLGAEAETREQLREAPAPKAPVAAIAEAELVALQARLEDIHASKLLTDDELHGVEDLLADWTEVEASMVEQVVTEVMLYASAGLTFAVGVKVHKLIKISVVTPGDAAFARQVRRKFL